MTNESFVPKVIKDFNEQLNDPNRIPLFQFEPEFQASDSYGNHDNIKRKLEEQLKHNRKNKTKEPSISVYYLDSNGVETLRDAKQVLTDEFGNLHYVIESPNNKKPKHPLGHPEDDLMEGANGDW